jgi:hypothetical protein
MTALQRILALKHGFPVPRSAGDFTGINSAFIAELFEAVLDAIRPVPGMPGRSR